MRETSMHPVALTAHSTAHRPAARRWHWTAATIAITAVAFYVIEHSFATSAELAVINIESAELDEIVAAGNSLRRIAFAVVGICGLCAWRWPRRDLKWRPTIGSLALLAYFAWCVASILWADDPAMTLRRFGVLTFFFFAVMGLGRQFSPRQLAWLVLCVGTAHLLWGIFAEISLGMFRPWMEDYRFAGTVHPNTQGIQCAGICLAVYALNDRRQRGWWLMAAVFVLAAVCLFLTRSRTSCAAAVVGMGIMWLPHAPRWVQGTAFVLPPLTISTLLLAVLLWNIDLGERVSGLLLMGRQEEAGTLTGRLPLWDELADYARQRPLVGYGYGGFWNVQRTRDISESQGWQIAHSHSAYFETLLNLGAVGLILALLTAGLATARVVWKHWTTGDPGWSFLCGLFVFAAIYSVTDAGFALPGFMTLVVYAAMAHTLCWKADCDSGQRYAREPERQIRAIVVQSRGGAA